MIPFALFTTTILDSGIVRVDFNNITWTQTGDTWTYTIPRSTHLSGIYPKTNIVDNNGHELTKCTVQYNNYAVILVAVTPITSFTAYFMGDNSERVPSGVLPPRTLFATNNKLYHIHNNQWYTASLPAINNVLSWLPENTLNLPIDPIIDATFNELRKIVVTQSGVVYSNRLQETLQNEEFFNTISSKVIRVGATGRTTPSLANNIIYLALLENGELYANGTFTEGNPQIITNGEWVKLNTPEPINELNVNNVFIIARGVSGKVYGSGDVRAFPGITNVAPYQLNEVLNNHTSINARDVDVIGYCTSYIDDNTGKLFIAGVGVGNNNVSWYDSTMVLDGLLYSVSSSCYDRNANSISGWLSSTDNELYKMVYSVSTPTIIKTGDHCDCVASGAFSFDTTVAGYGVFGVTQSNIIFHTPTTRFVYNLPE